MPESIAQALYYYRKKGKLTYKQMINRSLMGVRAKAKRLGTPCDITIDDLVLNKVCPVLGIPLSHSGHRDNTPSIDKINPKLGYVKGNVRVISCKANRWKDNMSLEDAKLLISNWDKISS